MKRPITFSDVYGHQDILNLFQARVNDGTLPHFIILYGEEGLGKTTIARLLALALTCENAHKPCYSCDSCKENQDLVIQQGKSSSNVFLYRMSVEGGKDVAKELISNINSCMGKDVKVFIADEAQRMSDAAQDVLLHDTEHLPDKVFLIMCTTDITRINKTLRSRAVKYYLPRLSHSTITSLVLKELQSHNLRFQNMPMVAEMISTISDHKPREALSIVEALGYDRTVSLTELSSVLQMPDVSEFKSLVSTFKGSVTEGISKIFSMDITSQTQQQLCCYIVETLKFMNGIPVYMYDVGTDIVTDIDQRTLTEFLYHLSNLQNFNKVTMLSAYLMAHPNGVSVASHSVDKIDNEILYMSKHATVTNNSEEVFTPLSRKRPTAEDLLRNSSIH